MLTNDYVKSNSLTSNMITIDLLGFIERINLKGKILIILMNFKTIHETETAYLRGRWTSLLKILRETCRAHLIEYLCFYCYHWIDDSAGGLLVPDGIIRPVISRLVQTWFMIYIHNWNILNNVIIIKTKVIFPQAYVVFSYTVHDVLLILSTTDEGETRCVR